MMSIVKKTIVDDYLLNEVPKGENPGEHHHDVGSELSVPRIISSSRLGEFNHICTDPVFLYLKFCENLSAEIEVMRSNLKPGQIIHPPSGKPFPGIVYDRQQIDSLAQNSMAFIIMLFSSLEAFLNEHIPEDFTYSTSRKVNGKKQVVKLNRSEIQRTIGTKEKLTKVYKKIFKKDISKKKNLYDSFINIKILRDEINHLKAVKPMPKFKAPKEEIPSFGEDGKLKVTCRLSPQKVGALVRDENAWIITNLVDLNVSLALEIVVQIMNFFIEDYVKFRPPKTLGQLAKEHAKNREDIDKKSPKRSM